MSNVKYPVVNGMKKCADCKRMKPVAQFHKARTLTQAFMPSLPRTLLRRIPPASRSEVCGFGITGIPERPDASGEAKRELPQVSQNASVEIYSQRRKKGVDCRKAKGGGLQRRQVCRLRICRMSGRSRLPSPEPKGKGRSESALRVQKTERNWISAFWFASGVIVKSTRG